MVVSKLDRGRDALNARPPDTEGMTSMLNQLTTFGDPRLPARFWEKVNKDGPVPASRPELGPCWMWLAGTFSRGYGVFQWHNKARLAHHFVYEKLRGPVPKGLELDHLCRNTSCVNLSHLEAVTHRENVLRGDGVAAHRARQTHCKRGHALTEENVYLYPRGGNRACRVCRDAAGKKRRAMQWQ